jgi:hypothetical protein
MLGKSCFSLCTSLSTVTFESGSQLSSIAELHFLTLHHFHHFAFHPAFNNWANSPLMFGVCERFLLRLEIGTSKSPGRFF